MYNLPSTWDYCSSCISVEYEQVTFGPHVMLAWKNHYSNKKEKWPFYNIQTLAAVRCSVTKSSLTLLDPMACSTPGLLVPHYVPEFAQVHVHCIGDAIQPSHPLSPSSSAFSLCQHQVFFQCVGSLYHVAKY